MSAETLSKSVVEAHQSAQMQLTAFHTAIDNRNSKEAAIALQRAAQAICYGLSRTMEDSAFWSEAAGLLQQAERTPGAVDEVLGNLDDLMKEEGRILTNGGYSAEVVSEILREFELTLSVFKQIPNPNTLDLAKTRISQTKNAICALGDKPVEIIKDGYWGRAYRAVKSGLRSLNGVGTIVSDVATAGAAAAASGGILAPWALGIAAASIAGGIVTVMTVGEDIYGGLRIQR